MTYVKLYIVAQHTYVAVNKAHDLHVVVSGSDSWSESKNDCDLANIMSLKWCHVKVALSYTPVCG